jgi:hypothetical protein
MCPVNVESESDALTGDNEPGKPVKKSFYSEISEDGWALWIGGLLITIVLLIAMLSADFKFTSPDFNGQMPIVCLQKYYQVKTFYSLQLLGLFLLFFLWRRCGYQPAMQPECGAGIAKGSSKF